RLALFVCGQDYIENCLIARGRFLGNRADPRFPGHVGAAGIGADMALDQVEQRCLAGSVLAHETGLGARRDDDRGVLEQWAALDAIGEIGNGQHGGKQGSERGAQPTNWPGAGRVLRKMSRLLDKDMPLPWQPAKAPWQPPGGHFAARENSVHPIGVHRILLQKLERTSPCLMHASPLPSWSPPVSSFLFRRRTSPRASTILMPSASTRSRSLSISNMAVAPAR